MRFLFGLVSAALIVSSVGVPAVRAQPGPPDSTTYVLREFSNSQEGCFDPCDCPILLLYLGGTFDLRPAGTPDGHQLFAIEKIDWIVTVGGPVEQHVTGSGTFQVSEEHQRLQLQLQFDGGPVEEYDSGLVPRAAELPAIEALASIGDLFCYDRAVLVRAGPLDPDYLGLAVERYLLNWSISPDSATYDVVTGDLGLLRHSDGDFAAATSACLADGAENSVLDHVQQPEPRQALWFVVRGAPAAPYDSNGPAQADSRDTEIDLAAAGCPAHP